MEKKHFYESTSQSNSGLFQQIEDCIASGNSISEKLAYDLMNAKRSQLSWELFYKILEVPGEAGSGYWNATNVACTLLMPVIRSTFLTAKNNRINEDVEEDFLSEVKMEIQKCIPGFDKNVSHFPNYVKTYILHAGYIHNKDSSTYMEKKKGIRIYSQNALQAQNGEEETTSADPYAQTKSSFLIEDKIEQKEKQRSSRMFSDVVVAKRILSDKDLQSYQNALSAREKREKLLHQTNKIIKSVEKLPHGASIDVNGTEVSKENLKSLIKERKDAIKSYDDIIRNDFEKTTINAAYWHMFLGGFASFPEAIKEGFYESTINGGER